MVVLLKDTCLESSKLSAELLKKKKVKHNRINWKAHLCAQMSAHSWAWDLYSDKVLLFLFVRKRVLLKNKWLIKQCKETGEDHFIVKK